MEDQEWYIRWCSAYCYDLSTALSLHLIMGICSGFHAIFKATTAVAMLRVLHITCQGNACRPEQQPTDSARCLCLQGSSVMHGSILSLRQTLHKFSGGDAGAQAHFIDYHKVPSSALA